MAKTMDYPLSSEQKITIIRSKYLSYEIFIIYRAFMGMGQS